MRLRFGGFLAPHHPIGEHPMLQYRRDLDLVEQLDRLGYDEFWCGEHHSTGWEVIPSPEMFLAAAGERSHRIMLGTGVLSLPYHHPFHVADRIVQLDLMTGGRAILGTGPGALPSDAKMLGIDPIVLRDRQDEAIGVVKRLLAGERFSYSSDWFTLVDARLQMLPMQAELPMAVASMVSPSGPELAGKYGVGLFSIGSMLDAGIAAMPTQWSFVEEAAARHGQRVDRRDWRVLMNWHIAETRDEARRQAIDGLHRWHNEYAVATLNPETGIGYASPEETLDTLGGPGGSVVVGTPDDLVARIRELYELSGGFGCVIGFVNDWAIPDYIARSWDMVARYVIPEVNGLTTGFTESRQYVIDHRESFQRAGEAILAKINGNERARAVFETEGVGRTTLAVPQHTNVNHATD
jgi:limonene 1,2-monooxygenase